MWCIARGLDVILCAHFRSGRLNQVNRRLKPLRDLTTTVCYSVSLSTFYLLWLTGKDCGDWYSVHNSVAESYFQLIWETDQWCCSSLNWFSLSSVSSFMMQCDIPLRRRIPEMMLTADKNLSLFVFLYDICVTEMTVLSWKWVEEVLPQVSLASHTSSHCKYSPPWINKCSARPSCSAAHHSGSVLLSSQI